MLQSLATDHASDVPKGIEVEKGNWDFEGMVTPEEVATTGVCGKLQEVQRICGDDSEAVSTTVVDVTVLTREDINMKRKNVTMSTRQIDLEAKLVETRAAGYTMRSQATAAEDRIKSLKTQLADAQLAFERSANESSWTEGDLRTETIAVEELFDKKRGASSI